MHLQKTTGAVHPILPARLDWPSAIGLFLLNFGTLEYVVFAFLKDHLTEDEFSNVREWHFKDRISRIDKYFREGNHPVESRCAFTRLSKRLDDVRQLRNHIAHGHMLYRINPDTSEPSVTLFKAKDVDGGYSPDSEHLEFKQLCTALNTLTEVIDDFQRVTGWIREQNNVGYRSRRRRPLTLVQGT